MWAWQLQFTILSIWCLLLVDASHVRRANLAPGRGAGLLTTTTTTVRLASGRGQAQISTATSITKTSTSSKTTSTTRKTTSTSSRTSSTARSTTTTKPTSTTSKKTSTTTSKKTATTVKTTTTKTTTTKATTTKTTMTTSATASSTLKPVSSKKKGLSYNDAKYTKLFGNNVAWAYNWYSAPNADLPSNIEFAPMLWSNATDLTSVWANNVKAEKTRGGDYLLGFNEPDLGEQANMTVSQSVAAWKKYMEPYKKDFKLVSPAVTNGGSPMGVAYMQNFLSNCTSCQIDAVALHWYDAAWNTGYFFNYLNDAIKAFSPRPIWLTEFRGSGTAAEQIKFINTVVPWLENQPQIERYALFGLFEGAADDGNMVTNGKLNEVGLAYAQAA